MICHSIDRLDRFDWLSRQGSARFAIVTTASIVRGSVGFLIDRWDRRASLISRQYMHLHVIKKQWHRGRDKCCTRFAKVYQQRHEEEDDINERLRQILCNKRKTI